MISARIRATVVLPAPLSPTKAVTLRASRLTETLSTAWTGALRANKPLPCLTQKRYVRLRPSRTGAGVMAGAPGSIARARHGVAQEVSAPAGARARSGADAT